MRHTRRNPQKSPADPAPDPEKIVKLKKTSQKGASGSGKPKKTYASLKDKVITENIQLKDIEPSVASEKIPSQIHIAPCSVSSPLNLSPNKASHTVHHIPLCLSSISLFPTIQSGSILPPIPVMAGQ